MALGCTSDIPDSDIPELELDGVAVYKNKAGKDSMVVLSLNYKDGDGDLGLSKDDTLPPYNYGNVGYYTLLVSYKIAKNKVWQHIVIPSSADTLHFNQRFQRLSLADKKKAVSGNLMLRIPASPYPGLKPDSIMLTSYILDRSLHKSNQVATNAIKLQH